MKQNEENSKDKSNKKDGNKENLEMLLDNNSETYQIMKNQRLKNIKKEQFYKIIQKT